MIRVITQDEAALADFAFELCIYSKSASYPRFETREEVALALREACRGENRELIACEEQGTIEGVCAYFWEMDGEYAQTTLFLARENAKTAYAQMLSHIKSHLPGKRLHVGVSGQNVQACAFLLSQGFAQIESSGVWRSDGLAKESGGEDCAVRRIGAKDFDVYAPFHDRFALPLGMYYDSRHLRERLERFRVLIFEEDGEIQGSIFAYIFQGSAEVFGLFARAEVCTTQIPARLLHALLRQLAYEGANSLLYMIEEKNDWEQAAAREAGLICKDAYRLYHSAL